MLTLFLSNHCILRLVLNVENQEKSTIVCVASCLSLDGRISSHFDNIRLKLSTRAYFMVLSHSMRAKFEIIKIYFHDVVNNELFYECIQLRLTRVICESYQHKSVVTKPSLLETRVKPRVFLFGAQSLASSLWSTFYESYLCPQRDARISVIKRDGNWWYGELDGNVSYFSQTA